MAIYGFKSYLNERSKKVFWSVFTLTAVLLNFMTVSRSGIFPMVFCVLLFLFYPGAKVTIKGYSLLIFIVGGAVLAGYGLYEHYNSDQYVKIPMLTRLINTDTEGVLYQGHLDVRLMALHHWWFDLNLPEKIFGIGAGHYEIRFHLSSPHMTFLAYLLEIGLLGFLNYCLLFILTIIIIINNVHESRKRAYCISLLLYLIMTATFYNYIRVSLWYIALGYLIAIVTLKREESY